MLEIVSFQLFRTASRKYIEPLALNIEQVCELLLEERVSIRGSFCSEHLDLLEEVFLEKRWR